MPSGDIAGQYEIEFTEDDLSLSHVQPPSKKRKLQHNWTDIDNDHTGSELLPLKLPFNETSVYEKLEEKLESITDQSVYLNYFLMTVFWILLLNNP